MHRVLTGIRAFLRTDHPAAQLGRYFVVGVIANVAYFVVFVTIHPSGSQLANVLAFVVSTSLANELHRQLSFRVDQYVGWLTAQREGGAVALIGLAVSSTLLVAIEIWLPGMGSSAQALAVIAVSGLVGVGRFIVLRWLWWPRVATRRKSPDFAEKSGLVRLLGS